ncbi:MAG TPA: ATP-grasp domain-containing protein [Holophagaceae bacterium]|nr:ATP-grasp domain-containing protein [Holophagaceae bacterium]
MLTVGITGSGGGVGSAVLKSLAMASLETQVVCFDTAASTPGMFRGDRARLIPNVADPAYREALLEACEQEGLDVLIPGLDPELEPLAAMAADLEALGCTLIGSSPLVNRLLFDKLRSSDFFEGFGLPFAKTVPMARVEELLDLHGLPLLIKPVSGSASRGVHVVFDLKELKALAAEGVAYVAQNYLLPLPWGKSRKDLRPEDVYSNHSLVQRDEHMVQVLSDPQGDPLGVFYSRNVLKEGAVVHMTPLEGDPHGARAAAIQMAKCLAEIGQVGPCNFQGRVTAEGPFFYEINPRFSGGTGMRACLGFNEVEACLRRLVLKESQDQARACLATRYDQVCGMHPAERVMETHLIERLKREGRVDLPGAQG